jgi:hypothetical protein
MEGARANLVAKNGATSLRWKNKVRARFAYLPESVGRSVSQSIGWQAGATESRADQET